MQKPDDEKWKNTGNTDFNETQQNNTRQGLAMILQQFRQFLCSPVGWILQFFWVAIVYLISVTFFGNQWPLAILVTAVTYLHRMELRDDPKETEAVVITGCDSGLGYSLALHLQSLNFRVVAAVHKPDSAGARELSKNAQIFVHPLDITDNESVKTFYNAVRTYLVNNKYVLRAFVNNAGAMIFGEFEWQTEDQVRYQVEVNLLGTMRITREFMPIIRSHSTRLIVVTSHCASEALPGVAVYGATKAALKAWATSLRVELKKFGAHVISFVPGSFINQSNLLCQQRNHFDTMHSAMSDDAKALYSDYFKRYSSYLSNLAPSKLPQILSDETIYNEFTAALLDRLPKAEYRCEPWRYKFYRITFWLFPVQLRDILVERFVQLPPWKNKESPKI